MDKNVTLERRFSLNMTHLPNPIAESTTLNLNGSTASASNTSHFQWGGTSISPKQRSSSSTCHSKTGNTHHAHRSSTASPQRAKMNLSKIDPRIYADVQSRGLVSRIVKYHENGTRLNRSLSASNLYNKPGKFPVVHLQKKELPYRATQQNVSMTRIAPPEKSAFYGNTLSSLLRSNSVICLQKSDEEISRENRPILHPPAAEGEMAPTRSVLDVLKEISRKRINSDDTDIANDTIKKYCNRDYADGMYNGAVKAADIRHISTATSHLMSPTNSHLSYKRQREPMGMPPQYSHPGHAVAAATALVANRTAHPAQIAQQQQQQPQHSPEQIAKKRLYSYNNDITSSLSSSMIHANKRKFYEQRRSALQRSSPPTAEEYEMHKAKIQRQQQPDLRFQQLTKTFSYATPITPIPPTPLSRGVEALRPAPSMPAAATLSSLTVEAEPKRTISEPIYMGARARDGDTASRPAASTKPKLTLFNKNYDEAATQTSCANGKVEEEHAAADDECADIQFVKPKKSSSLSSGKNPVIERTQKSKLALMLCGLRGELYQGDADEVDVAVSQPATAVVTTTVSATRSSLTLSTTVSTTTSNTTTTTTTTAITSKASPTTLTTNVTLGSGTLKLPAMPAQSTSTPTAAAAASQTTAATTTTSNAATVAGSTTTTTAPILGGFKFTPPAATTISTSTTTTSTSTTTTSTSTTSINAASMAPAKSASPLVGIKLTPSPQTPALSSAPLINFSGGTLPSSSLANSIATGIGPVPHLQGFAFPGSDKSAATTAPPAASVSAPTQSTATATTQAGGFKFGLSTTTTTSAAGTAPAFGAFTNTQPVTNAAATTTATLPAKGTEAVNNTATPTFSFKAPSVTTSANLTKSAFSFGGAATTTATTTPSSGSAGTFTFGPTATTTAPAFAANNSNATTANPPPIGATSNASNAFGNTFATATTAPTFAFGVPQTTNSTTTSTSGTTATTTSTGLFAFGTNSAQQKPAAAAAPFAFGGGVKATATTTTTATTTAPPASGAFTFGQSNAAATTTTTAAPNMFAFGGASAQPAAANTTVNTTNNLFSNVATNNASAAAKPTTFTFGSTAGAGAQQQQAPPAFGSTATPFAFGGASTADGDKADKPATASFGFGNTPANNATRNPFGNSNTTAATHQVVNPATGVVKPSFSFGGSGNTSTTDAAKPLFGGTSTNNSSSNNTFGALAQQNKTFSFGANSNSTATNIFGGAVGAAAATSNNPAVNSTGGFSFGSTGGNNNSTANATSASKPIAAAFSFSGASNSNNTAPFSFGSGGGGSGLTAATKLNSNTAAATPNFSFGTSAATNGGNIFGSAHKADSAPATTPFSFSAGTATSNGASAPNGNLFAPPPNMGAGPGDRPIRRATRRLQKP